MDKQRLLELQTQRGTRVIGSETNIKTFEYVVNECRKLIQDKSDQYRDLDAEDRQSKIRTLIVSYVMGLEKQALVEGFYTADKKLETNLLIDKLTQSILDYGILTDAINDPNVFEIRANGREIKVEVNGRVKDLTNKDGEIVRFESPEEQSTILRKLMGDVRLSPKDAVVSARTMEGFRIAVNHSSTMGDDPAAPKAPKYHSFVLRKFHKKKMDLSDIVAKGTLSDNMARFLSLMMAGGLTFFTAGPTASGKSTTNNAILQYVPMDTRVVLLQNPSEIDLRFKDPVTGRVINDCLHLEYIEKDNPGPHDPTSVNLMAQILRLSPTFVCFGEWRSNKEFKLGIQIAQAGHPINSTLHAETAEGAVTRIQTAYLAESGNEPASLALKDITDVVNIIIIQKIMRDGTRKVLDISEIGGVDPNDENRPEVRPLFKFVTTGDPIYAPDGTVESIPGRHVRVGKLSDELINKLKIEGIATSRMDFILNEPEVDENGEYIEQETYTGKNIRNYGMKFNK